MFSIRRRKKRQYLDLTPDEVLVDARNFPRYNEQQFEGQLERPIKRHTFWYFAIFCFLIFLVFGGRVFWLAVVKGEYYANRSQNNSLNFFPIFAERGNIYDRQGKELSWTRQNFSSTSSPQSTELTESKPIRTYIDTPGFGHLLGYVSYPTPEEMATGKYNPAEHVGRSGIEKSANDILLGVRGKKIIEVNATGKQESDHIVQKPIPGKEIKLSIDSRVQAKLYEEIKKLANDRGFIGGAGIIMDVNTGEILSLVSYPDYDSNVFMQDNNDSIIKNYFSNAANIMLNRAVSGLYTPGSVFKPFVAMGALSEKLINPNKSFVTNGQLVIPNPYNPEQKTIFKDWKDNGVVDMYKAIEMSSNVYFYIIGGGFGQQPGLGIKKIGEYAKLFKLTELTNINLPGEKEGTLPSPEWKAKTFNGEPWRLGDTYHTAIGQYGVLITPIQMVRAYALLANGGYLVSPNLFLQATTTKPVAKTRLNIEPANFAVIHEGMKRCALTGTAKALNLPGISVAAKTGTAELGETKERVNSWVAGFWPAEKPRFAFVVVMEKGSRSNLVGGTFVMRQVLDWMRLETPEYLKAI